MVIIHGMGDPEPHFAQPLVDGLKRQLGREASAFAFQPCFWANILQPSQDRIFALLENASAPMRLNFLRKWVVGTLGDPTGYLSGYEQGGVPVLQTVHRRLAESLGAVERELRDPSTAPLIVLAHSLGGVVVTNYLWNLERAAGEVGAFSAAATPEKESAKASARRPIGDTPFQQMQTLAGLVTFGCNIPLFLPPSAHYECVRFPRPALPANLRAAARWLNVFDPYDILGYPLNDLWDERHGTMIDDVTMEVGMPGISLTPLSHNYYWTDAEFQATVAAELTRVLGAVRDG